MINQVVPNYAHGAYSEFSQPKQGWYLTPQKNMEDEKKKHKYGKTIVFSALAVGFGTMLLMKGSLPKKTSIYLEKLKIKLEQKIERGSKFAGLYKKTVNTINSFIQKTQSINNITSLKDILVQKLMYSNKYTKKVHKGITKFFNRISRKTVNSSYEKTGKKIAEFNEYILSLNERILKEHPNDNSIKNTINSINSGVNRANCSYNNGFGVQARTLRLSETEDATKDLFDYMWNASYNDIKNFRSKNMYQTFIADEKMSPFKKALAEKTSNEKRLFMEEISKIMEEYKKILPENEYSKLKAKLKSIEKSLDNSIKTETLKYPDKARDLKLGSAPTDILSILFAIGTVGWFLGKSKDNDERISASVKYGIPAIGAISTSLYCTTRLISGGKSLAFGLLSGWLMNRLGTQIDNLRKKYYVDLSLKDRSILKEQSVKE